MVIEPVTELLSHESRRVRIEAVRVLASAPSDARQRYATTDSRRAFDLALAEYRKSLMVQNDRAMSHAMLADLYQLTGELTKAMDSYRTAIVVEPNLAGPRANLAYLLDAQVNQLRAQMRPNGNPTSAEQLSELNDRIQLLAGESAKLRGQEHALLRKDLERSEGLPGTHGLHYRFAMSSYLQNDLSATEKHLLKPAAEA